MRPWIVPDVVEAALRAAAEAELGGPVGGPALTRAVVDRSRRYTSERDRLTEDPAGDLAARACFFTIADCAKPMIPLAELAHAGAMPVADPLRVVDLGAGCGAMSLGLVLSMTRPIELVMIDHDARALAIARRAITQVAPEISVRVVAGDIAGAVVPRCDLVLIGSLLNELDPATAEAVVVRALAAIRDDGAVIIVEPALREPARALHALRDRLIAGGATAFAPCPHQVVPCPMLASERDWCHEDRPVVLPPRTRQIANATGLRDGAMKFSYLVMRRQPGTVVPGALRIVGQPRPQKGKHELFACGERGYGVIRLLTRHKRDGNRELLRAERGDLLTITPPLDQATADLGPEHVVELHRPANPVPDQ